MVEKIIALGCRTEKQYFRSVAQYVLGSNFALPTFVSSQSTGWRDIKSSVTSNFIRSHPVALPPGSNRQRSQVKSFLYIAREQVEVSPLIVLLGSSVPPLHGLQTGRSPRKQARVVRWLLPLLSMVCEAVPDPGSQRSVTPGYISEGSLSSYVGFGAQCFNVRASFGQQRVR